jgi:hypothetical protein
MVITPVGHRLRAAMAMVADVLVKLVTRIGVASPRQGWPERRIAKLRIGEQPNVPQSRLATRRL